MAPVHRGQTRAFSANRYVYAVITSRARGLSVGVNVNPDRHCNFDCPYCEVRRTGRERFPVHLPLLRRELREMLLLAREKRLRTLPAFARVPEELLALREVALSGDGEPSLAPEFRDIVSEVLAIRRSLFPFKLVLITNGTGLHRPPVREGIGLFAPEDELWIKLDAGTEEGMRRINRPGKRRPPLERVLKNIAAAGALRPVVIQSLFCEMEGRGPDEAELDAYLERLRELQAAGTRISLVQVYSVSRAPARPGCTHLPLRELSRIARRVREVTGLRAEVF